MYYTLLSEGFIKKISLALLFIFSLTLSPLYIEKAESKDSIDGPSVTFVDKRDKTKKLSVETIKLNDIVYLPLGDLCRFYGILYKYDPETKGVTLFKGDKSATIVPNSTKIICGNKDLSLESPSAILNNRTIVPPSGIADLLSYLLDYTVSWRASKRLFTVNDNDPVTFWEDNPEKAENTEESGNIIEPGDELVISVWQKGSMEIEELTRERIVEHDGTIKLPFIGSISVWKLTPSQLEKRIAAKLKPYIKNPDVTVTLKSEKVKYTVQIFGEVRKPGTYEFNERVTIMQAVNRAGGFTDRAKLKHVRVTRFIHHSPYKTEIVDAKEILYNGQRQYDIPVEDKDIVFVPKKSSFWGFLGSGISKVSPLLSTTALIITIILSARKL